jgi:hypothetical protein
MAKNDGNGVRDYVVMEDVTPAAGGPRTWEYQGTFKSATAKGAIAQAVDERGDDSPGPVIFLAFPLRNETLIKVEIETKRTVTLRAEKRELDAKRQPVAS